MQYVFLLILAILFVPVEATCEASQEALLYVETLQSEEESEKHVIAALEAAFASAIL